MAQTRIVAEVREKVAIACRIIGSEGLTRGMFGHVSARVHGMTYSIGDPKPIPEADIFEYRKRAAERRDRPPRESSSRYESNWRYHVKLLQKRGR